MSTHPSRRRQACGGRPVSAGGSDASSDRGAPPRGRASRGRPRAGAHTTAEYGAAPSAAPATRERAHSRRSQMGSAALVAEGMCSRVDGYTSLTVLRSAIGAYVSWAAVDSLIGVGITAGHSSSFVTPAGRSCDPSSTAQNRRPRTTRNLPPGRRGPRRRELLVPALVGDLPHRGEDQVASGYNPSPEVRSRRGSSCSNSSRGGIPQV